MSKNRRIASGLCALAAAMLLGGCAMHRPHGQHSPQQPGMHAGQHAGMQSGMGVGTLSPLQLQLLAQDADRNGIRDQDERVQSVKACRGDPCDLTVSVVDNVVPVPGVGDNCGVSLDFDIVLMGESVTKIGWQLKQPAGTASNVFRFSPLKAEAKDKFGVYLYADAGRVRFVPSEPRADYFVLTRSSRQLDGFAYGVYLQWKPKTAPDSDYKPCIGLDPIIIEHN